MDPMRGWTHARCVGPGDYDLGSIVTHDGHL